MLPHHGTSAGTCSGRRAIAPSRRLMRVLLTGASSFTGAWFAQALLEADCEVVAALRGSARGRKGVAAERLALVRRGCELVPRVPFGSPAFLDLLRGAGPFDILCHHGAVVGDHRRGDFDVDAAVAANCRDLEAVLDALAVAGGNTVLLTGSVFESDEGAGDPPLRAFSPYGLAKTLTWHRFRFACERRGVTLGKLVVPSPFGPLEKDGFTAALVRAWLRDEEALVRRPRLVRDQVPVRFLAAAYARFATALPGRRGTLRAAPSGFAEPLASFAQRMAEALRPRLGRRCRTACADPPEATDEPLVRRGLERLPEADDRVALDTMWCDYATWWRDRATVD